MAPYHRIYRVALVLLLAAFAHAITNQDNHVLLADDPVPSIAANREKIETELEKGQEFFLREDWDTAIACNTSPNVVIFPFSIMQARSRHSS